MIVVNTYSTHPNILLGHSTGNTWWDIPKGVRQDGEELEECAKRELFEETGIVCDVSELKYVGMFEYNSHKDLHIFILFTQYHYHDLVCESVFESRHGIMLPELDRFSILNITDKSRVYDFLTKNMGDVITEVLRDHMPKF